MSLAILMRPLVLTLGMAAAATVAAADKPGKGAAPPDEKAIMEAMVRAGTPGEGQSKLEPLVGTFEARSKSWMDPAKPPEEATGTSTRKWIMGKRYVQEDYVSTFQGQPFTGLGYQGYDNVTKRYVGTWMDSMSTGLMNSTGSFKGNVLTSAGSMADPVTGKNTSYTMALTLTDNDHQLLEMWGTGPGGKKVKWMEIAYTRKR